MYVWSNVSFVANLKDKITLLQSSQGSLLIPMVFAYITYTSHWLQDFIK